VYHCALKIPKNFLNIFYRGRPHLFTQHLKLRKGRGPLCEVGFSGLHAGPGDGAEEWLGLKGPAQVRLAYAAVVHKTLSFYTQGYPNTYDRNSFFKKACRRSYL
jgi:hypothetical protein